MVDKWIITGYYLIIVRNDLQLRNLGGMYRSVDYNANVQRAYALLQERPRVT